MVNTPAFGEAAALVRERVPTLGVGLHLNLLAGRPLAVVPTLADPRSGEFYSFGELARRAMIGRVSASDVRRECDAQLAALAAEGISITHLDSHRHTHALPGVLPAVLASARAAGVRVVRRPLDEPTTSDPAASAKMLVLHGAWRVAMRGVAADDRVLLARSPELSRYCAAGSARRRASPACPARPAAGRSHGDHDASGVRRCSARGAGSLSPRAGARGGGTLLSRGARADLERDLRLVHFGELG